MFKIETDENAELYTQPHYTDERFRKEQTVFGAEESNLSYDYDDRIRQWDYQKHEMAWDLAKKTGHKVGSQRFYEAYLSKYFGKPILLKHVIAGVNRGNGYPYVVFGYKFKE